MNKKLLSIFVFTLCFIGNMWVSAQIRFTQGVNVSQIYGQNDQFYLYNLGANRFLNQGTFYDTHAILDGAGLKVKAERTSDNNHGYLYTGVNNGYLFLDYRPGVFVDGQEAQGNKMEFEFVRIMWNTDIYDNLYLIRCIKGDKTYYLGWAGGGGDSDPNANPRLGQLENEVILSEDFPSTEAFLWMFIKPEHRAFDHTTKLVNPDFERGFGGESWQQNNFGGWTSGNFQKMTTFQTFTNATFAEKWIASGYLSADEIYQYVNLPEGNYTLSVTAQAINENKNNAPCTTGVYLYLGNSRTLIGAAGTYEVTTHHNGGDLKLGVVIENGNDANWVAFDNVRLFEKDFYFTANSATVDNGTTYYDGIKLHGANGNVTYSTECYGNIQSAEVYDTGQLRNIQYKEGDRGGAVVVHATCNGRTATYVLTVAYKQHLWDFTNTYSSSKPHGDVLTFDPYPGILQELRANNTDWTVVYKVRTYTGRDLTYLNGPVYSNASAINGTNADYNAYTAGLLIQAEAKAFGANSILPDDYYFQNPDATPKPIDQRPGKDKDRWEGVFKTDKYSDLMGIDPREMSGASGVTLFRGSKLTIPKLKMGQYVRVKWRRHAENTGDKVLLTRLSDLKDTPMDYVLVNNNRMKRVGRGYHVFIVKEDGDVSFQVDDNGWLNIYSIEVSDDFLDDNCWNDIVKPKLNGGKAGTMDTELNFPGFIESYNSSNQPVYNNTPVYDSGSTINWETMGNEIYGQSNISLRYKKEGLDGGAVSSTLGETKITNGVEKVWNDEKRKWNVVFTSTFKPVGHGQFVAVAEGFTYRVSDADFDAGNFDASSNHIYWLDLQRTLITVNEKGSTIQKYPYTWDFTRLSQRTIEHRLIPDTQRETPYWSGDIVNGFTPTAAYQKDFTENTEITTYEKQWDRDREVAIGNDYYGLAEYDGIGFNTNPVDGYSTSLKSIKVTADGTGLVIGDGTEDSKPVTLNLPQVDAGYTVYVRVKENSNASVTVGGESNIGYTSDTREKVYTYTTTEKADVPVSVKNADVKKIAVTKMTKTCWFKDGDNNVYYNTDSHDKNIDYSLTKYFTGKEVKAYTVSAINKDSKGIVTSVAISPIVKAPMNHGYIVSTEYDKNPNEAKAEDASLYKRPLFVPSIIDLQAEENDEGGMETADDSYLKPFVGGGSIYGVVQEKTDYDQYEYFVLTNRYYYTYDTNHTVKTAEVPGFYRLENISDPLANNRAYLVLTKAQSGTASSNPVKFIPLFDFDGELVDAIDDVPAEVTESVIDMHGIFYTLQGLKIEGFPQKGGIYIQNGKKVMVK